MLYWNETAWPIIFIEYCIILALLLFFHYQHGQHNQDAITKTSQWGWLKTVSDGNIWADIILYWNQTVWSIIYIKYCIILAFLLFFCYQHGQHNQHTIIKGINSLADWTLFLIATFGLTSEINQFGQWYTVSIASYWSSSILVLSAWPTQLTCKH